MSCSLLEGFYCGLKVVAACQNGHSRYSRSVRIVVTEAGTIWFDKFFTRNRVSEGKKQRKTRKARCDELLALELFVYKGTRFLQLPALMTHVSGLHCPVSDWPVNVLVSLNISFPSLFMLTWWRATPRNVNARVLHAIVSQLYGRLYGLLFLQSPPLSNKLRFQCP